MNFKKLIFMFIFFIILFPTFVNAAQLVVAVNQAYGVFYNDYYINELPVHESFGGRAFCLDHGLEYGYLSGYSHTIWEGPACAFTKYSENSASGTYALHYIIGYIQYYGNSSFSCTSYKYSSGVCDENNKNAVEDPDAKLDLGDFSSFELVDGYYVSTVNVEITGSVSNYVLSLTNAPSGTIVTTSSTSTTDILGSSIDNATVYVKVPKSSLNSTVSLSLTATSNYSTTCTYRVPGLDVYDPLYSYNQRVGFPTWKTSSSSKNFTTTDSLSLTVQPVVGTIKVLKIDEETSKVLSGAKFELYDSNYQKAKKYDGTLVGELVTDSNGIIQIDNLLYGTYILSEIEAPDNYYELDVDTKIVVDSSLEEVTIKNKLKKGTLKITKFDSVTGEVLEGVRFRLYTQNNEPAVYMDGTLVEELVTDENGEIIVKNLIQGSYLLREESNLPEYLKLDEDTLIIFDDTYLEISVTNDPIILKLSKQDITSHDELEGATIVITDNLNNVVKEWVSTLEKTEFYIAPGIYSLTETIAPSGYNKIDTIFKFKINNDGTIELIDSESKYLKLEDNVLVLYNDVEVIEVPDTLSTLNYVLIGLGAISIIGGIFIIYRQYKIKFNK